MYEHEKEDARILARQKAKRERVISLEAATIKDLMGTADGREFVWNLLEMCNVGTNAMRQTDRQTAFALGEHNIGQRILAMVTAHAPEQYITLLKERQNGHRT